LGYIEAEIAVVLTPGLDNEAAGLSATAKVLRYIPGSPFDMTIRVSLFSSRGPEDMDAFSGSSWAGLLEPGSGALTPPCDVQQVNEEYYGAKTVVVSSSLPGCVAVTHHLIFPPPLPP